MKALFFALLVGAVAWFLLSHGVAVSVPLTWIVVTILAGMVLVFLAVKR